MSGRPQGYGCTKGTSAADLQPVFGPPPGVGWTQPTTPPQPTSVPTRPPAPTPTQYIPPTSIPTSIPTQYTPPPTTYIPPTDNPVVYPTTPPPNSFSLPSLSLPVINTEPLKRSAKNTIIQSEKVLNMPAEAVNIVTQLDNSLEVTLSRFIENLINKIINH